MAIFAPAESLPSPATLAHCAIHAQAPISSIFGPICMKYWFHASIKFSHHLYFLLFHFEEALTNTRGGGGGIVKNQLAILRLSNLRVPLCKGDLKCDYLRNELGPFRYLLHINVSK